MKTKNKVERRTTIVVRRDLHKKLKIESTRKEISIFDLLDKILDNYFEGGKNDEKDIKS